MKKGKREKKKGIEIKSEEMEGEEGKGRRREGSI